MRSFKGVLVIIITIFVFIGIIISVFLMEKAKKDISPITPTPSVTKSATPSPENHLKYNKSATDKLLQIVKTRPALSANDDQIRQSLIASLDGKSGILKTTTSYQLAYIKSPNDFEVEILSTDVNAAKQEALLWLKSQGLSDDGICKLPIFFFLGQKASQSYKESGNTFNPLPDFCE